mmetsp:Transcript_21691/g.36260  ORF Transcript_21691/g.36260 Transcript_21691/m.36260 type:complete len:388 (-) Transcript_21691:185-1348(-)
MLARVLERRRVCEGARLRARLRGEALHDHANGHARGEGVRVDDDVWAYAAVQTEGHVHVGVQQAQRPLLPVPAAELVPDDGVAVVPELDRGPRQAAVAPAHHRDAVHKGWVLSLELVQTHFAGSCVHHAAPCFLRHDARALAREPVLVDSLLVLVVAVELRRGPPLAGEIGGGDAAPPEGPLGVALLLGQVDGLALVHGGVHQPALHAGLVDHHGVLHVVPGVGQHRHHRVRARRVLVHLVLLVDVVAGERALRGLDAVELVVEAVRVRQQGGAHGLLGHLALVHVARALVVVAPRGERGQHGEHGRRTRLLVRERQTRAAAVTAVRAVNIEVHLLEGADELHLSWQRRALHHRAHHARGAGEEEDARVGGAAGGRQVAHLRVLRDC